MADRLYIALDVTTYIYPVIDTEFNANLTFDAYRFVEKVDDQIYEFGT